MDQHDEPRRTCKACGRAYPLLTGFHRGPIHNGKRTYYRTCRDCRCEVERQRYYAKKAAGL